VHDRLRRSWRHLDFFQFEAWLHADVPRVACGGCGKTTQLGVPWARAGSGFTAAFEALALALCRELPVRQAAHCCAAGQAAVAAHRVLRRSGARLESFAGVQIVGIDETSLRRGSTTSPSCTTWMPSGCCSPPRGETTRRCWTSPADLKAHGGDPPRCATSAWT
jgi:transposase